MKKTISLLSKPFLAVAILVFSFFSNQKMMAQAGAALDFDGTDDYVNVPYDASFNAFPLTIEAWVKPNGGGEIVDRYIASSGNGYRLMLSGTNLNAWYYTPGAGGDASNPAATINCTANQWNHVAMTVTATELRFYVNGNPAGTYAPSSGGSFGAVTTTAPLSIGRFDSQTSNYFNGQIDEVRIWNTARDCGQISQQKDCELPSSEGNLVAYYQFNQGLAGGDNTNPPVNTLTDLATTLGGANDGTLNGFALTGATSNWVTPGGVTSGSSCGSVSYPEANIQGGSPLVSITDGDITPSTTDGTDHGSVLVGEPSAKTFTIQNTGTGDLTVSTITKTGTNQSEFEISGISLPATITAGSSVDFTVTFTPTATGSRTATIHVNSDDCDEADYDFAVKGTGAVAGAALAFDGTNDYISFPTTGMTAASGTISFWVNAAASQPVNSTSMVEFGGDNISIFFWNNGAQIYFRAGGIGSQSSPISYTGGSWKHVAMTWAGVGQTAKCYIDGVQVTTFTQTGAVNFGSTGYLGRSSSYANGLTNLLGSLDDVRFWNRMLCADEISALKNCEVSPSSDDLSVYFKCNQGTAGGDNTGITTLTDDATAIGGANDGSFFHFALDGATSNFIAPGGITGGACSPSIPEINLQGAGMNILDGDITPSTTDGTDHGSVLVGAPSAKTFTIQNTTGTGTLTISSISVMGTNSSEFVISGAPASIAAGGSSDFTVTFTPTATGSRTATIHVNNDDCDEADYDFAVQGTGAVAGAALSFDGTNDYVDCGNASAFNPNNIKTMETWVKFNSLTNDQDIMAKATTCTGIEMLLFGSNLAVYFMKDCSNFSYIAYPKSNLTAGQWHHIAVSWDGTKESIKMYLDGAPVGTLSHTGNINTTGLGNPANGLYLGQWGALGRPLNGMMDEARVWSRTLCQSEISAQKDCELSGSENGLVAYYKFNQGFAGGDNAGLTTLDDAAGTPQNGTLTNFALTGATSNWVAPGGVTSGNSCSPFDAPEINLQGAGMNNILDGDITPSTTDGTDHGAVLVGAPSAKTFTIQNTTGTGTLTISSISVMGTNSSEFVISGAPTSIAAGGSADFTVTFTPTATGSRTATIHVNNDDCDEADYDFAVQGTGAAAGASLSFDGSNDLINASGLGSPPSEFTVEFWLKAATLSDFNQEISLGSAGNGHWNGFTFHSTANGAVYVGTNIGNRMTPADIPANTVVLNTWAHFAYVYKGGTGYFYKNGSLMASKANSAPANFDVLRIGSGCCQPISGNLDELRIWTRALCQAEITAQKDCELGGSENGLVAYYKFNQGYASGDNMGLTTLDDAAGTPQNGTLTGFALTGATSNWVAPGGVTSGNSCSPFDAPDINLQGGSPLVSITDGDITPSTTDGTDHGTVMVGAPSAKTFTIQNTGAGSLSVSTITKTGTNESEFVVSGISLPATIAAGGSADFTVTFTPTATGSRTATIHVNNNDCDEADYDFAVQGTGAVAAAALSFDGVNDYVEAANESNFDLTTVTLEMWVKANTLGGFRKCLTKRLNGGSASWTLGFSGSNVHLESQIGSVITAASVPLNTWTHVAGVVENLGASTSLKIYINGVSAGSQIFSGTVPLNNSPFSIGSLNGIEFFDGQMDEVRIWSRALCQAEIAAQKDCELSSSVNGLVGYYKFNQGFAGGNNSGTTTLIDATANGNDGTLMGFALTGSTSNWVAPGGVTSGNSCSPFDAPEINLQGGSPLVSISDGDITPSTTDGTDHGSVLVGAPSTKTFTIQNTGAGLLTISTITLTGANAGNFSIQNAPSTVTAGGSATFDVVFTPSSAGLKTATVHVNSDDCDEADYDFAVQGTGAVAGASLDFDGSDDEITIGTLLSSGSSYTKEAWVYADQILGNNIIGSNENPFWVSTGGKLAAGHGNNYTVVQDAVNFPTDIWVHVAVVYDAPNATMTLFKNGTIVAQNTSAPAYSGGLMAIGSFYPGNVGFKWDGKIDEVRIWTRALCQAEISAQKDCELSGSENGLVAYYKFNQGIAGGDNMGLTTLDDAAGTPQNGTLTGFALTGATSNWVAPGGVTSGNSCSPFDAPDINLQGGSPLVSISDGDITPSTTDGTDHGSVLVGSPSTKTFTIQNTGAGLLTISTITLTGTNAGDFSIQNAPATVTAGGSATFDVVFTPSSAGLKTATIHVNNDDCDEADYDFAVQGTGAAAGKGLHFDGMNDYVSVASSANMPFSGDFTVEAWVYPQSTSESFPTIFSKNGDQLVMWFHTGAGNTVAARVAGAQLDGAALPLNMWSHVALTRLGTTARLYLNGVLQDTETTGTPSTGSSAFTMGLWTNNGRYFKGSIDEMRVWATARTAAEILASKDAEIAQMPNCLIQYYKFNQGTVGGDNSGQTTLTDIADATAENGTLNNFALTGATSNWASGASITENASTYLTNFPDINLVANGNNIADGTSTPSAANNTALGSVLNGAGKSRTFTIQNLGNEDLTVSTISFSGTNAADFSTSGISLPLTLAPNGNQNFTVTCNPSTVGAKTATINIVNNDCDEGNYDFAFSATGTTAFTFSSGSDWATAANWDVEIVPTTANMTSPRSVVIAQNCTMNSIGITFPSGTSLTVNSSKSLSPGTTSGITINSGATLTVQSTGSISQGFIDNYGTMNISGSYSAFYMTNRAAATLNVLSGGSYSCPACAETMMDASIVNNSGTLHLGTQSTWQADVTNNASGTITDGGNGAQITLGAQSTMLNNGSFVSRTAKTAGTFTNNGTFSMPATCNFTVQSGGAFTNNGNVTIVSSSQLTVQSSGAFANDGTGTVTNNGVFSVAGNFSQNGIFKGSGSFTGALFTNAASGTVRPGNSAGCITFANGLTSAGAVDIEIGGLTVCTGHDKITVTGTADITGSTFTASIIGSPSFSNGNTVTVLEATALTGTFSNVTLPPSWFINYTSSSVILSYGAVLPVELTFFEAKNEENGVRLDWQTASETNNRGFEIQRSADGLLWQKIGFEKGNGTTTDRHDYSFLDEKPLAGLNFYRLRQLDFDGKEDFSNIETVEMPGDGRGFSVFPNPISTGELTILFDEKMAGETTQIRLFNATGQLVKSINLSRTMDVSGLPPGIYSLEIGGIFKKIIVQ